MSTRRRLKQTKSFQDRLDQFIAEECSGVAAASCAVDQYELQKKIRQAETAANIEAWANSPGLQPPK